MTNITKQLCISSLIHKFPQPEYTIDAHDFEVHITNVDLGRLATIENDGVTYWAGWRHDEDINNLLFEVKELLFEEYLWYIEMADEVLHDERMEKRFWERRNEEED